MFPGGPRPFVHPDCLEEALKLASEHNIPVSDSPQRVAAEADVERTPDTKRHFIFPRYNFKF